MTLRTFEGAVLTKTGRIEIKLCTDVHGPQKMNFTDLFSSITIM